MQAQQFVNCFAQLFVCKTFYKILSRVLWSTEMFSDLTNILLQTNTAMFVLKKKKYFLENVLIFRCLLICKM